MVGLFGAAHPGPALAVTVVAALLSVSADLSLGRAGLVVAAVAAGQLSIGWSNDLADARRDRLVGRSDKPLVTGAAGFGQVRAACALAVASTVTLSLACGLAAGVIHLGAVAAGWVYNFGGKATWWSWLPYAVAFGALPVFIWTVPGASGPARVWMAVAGGLLGVGAHLVNVLPDLADDEATGVRGLPHRIGARWTPPVAVVVLVSATVVIVLGGPTVPTAILVPAALVTLGLATLALAGRGRVPFRAAIGIAVVDVVMMVLAA